MKSSRRSFIQKAALGSLAAISIPDIISAAIPKAGVKKITLAKDNVILFQGDSIMGIFSRTNGISLFMAGPPVSSLNRWSGQ